MTRAAPLLLLLAVACGSRPQPQRQRQRQPQPQPPGEAAMAEVIVALRAQRDRMCSCADAACVEEAEAAQFEWGFTHKELVDRAHGTRAQNHEADTLIEEAEACSHELRP